MPTIPAIPGLPSDPWGQWLKVNWDTLGFQPPGITQDVVNVIRDRNDPSAWIAFAATTLRTIWRELPVEIRDKLRGLISDAVAQLSEVFEQVATVADAIPLIGQILGAVIEVIKIFQSIHFESEQRKEEDSYRAKLYQQRAMLNALSHPNNWVLASDVLALNFLDYEGLTNWRLRACFDVNTGEALRMFRSKAGRIEEGHCGSGARRYTCPAIPKGLPPTWNCSPYAGEQGKRKACQRYVSLSALFYPFFNIGGVPSAIPVGRFTYDNNEVFITRQTALLTVPSVNLKVNASGVRSIISHFKNWWATSARELSRIDDNGVIVSTPTNERILVDAARNKAHVPSQTNLHKFYLDKDGLTAAYEGVTDADPTQWGIAQPGTTAAISVATANSVLAAGESFFAARSNMIRNTRLMQALVSDVNPMLLDSSVRDVVRYSASQFPKIDQLPAPNEFGEPVPEFSVVWPSTRKKSALPIVAVGGAAAAAYFILPRFLR